MNEGIEKEKAYISGPMTGIKDCNFPAFFKAEALLKEKGLIPINPARLSTGLSYRNYMDIALAMVRCGDSVLLLPGWESSKGAIAEKAYAESLSMKIFELEKIDY